MSNIKKKVKRHFIDQIYAEEDQSKNKWSKSVVVDDKDKPGNSKGKFSGKLLNKIRTQTLRSKKGVIGNNINAVPCNSASNGNKKNTDLLKPKGRSKTTKVVPIIQTRGMKQRWQKSGEIDMTELKLLNQIDSNFSWNWGGQHNEYEYWLRGRVLPIPVQCNTNPWQFYLLLNI